MSGAILRRHGLAGKTRAEGVRLRIRELAHARPRFGYLRLWVPFRREGWPISRTRVRRLYRLEGLQMRMRVRRRKHVALQPRPGAGAGGAHRSLEQGRRA